MATKAAPVTETFPSRLFTTQNIGSIEVTTADQASGAWFGDTSYQDAFKTLWGVLAGRLLHPAYGGPPPIAPAGGAAKRGLPVWWLRLGLRGCCRQAAQSRAA